MSRESILAVVRSDGGDTVERLAEEVVDGRAINRVETLELASAVHVQSLKRNEHVLWENPTNYLIWKPASR